MNQALISPRQQALLAAIITEYVETAKPVSSGQLVNREALKVSTATVRNDMVALEEAGWLHQPHTSAGRVPTEAAWKWHVANLHQEKALRQKEQTHLYDVVHAYRHSQQEMMRRLAKMIAELSDEAVILAHGKYDTYYTGLSNLFGQPEFETVNVLQNLSRVVDQMDDVMQKMFDRVDDEIRVMVGRDNPFSPDFGAIVVRYNVPHRRSPGGDRPRHSGVIAILGPLRQDYDEHVALLKHAQHLLKSL